MRKTYTIIAIAVGLAVVIVAVGLSDAADGLLKRVRSTEAVSNEATMAKTVRVYVRNPFKDDYGMSRISGYVENLGAREIAQVKLEIRLVDQNGDRKEVVYYDVKDVPGGRRRSFDANAGALGGARRAEAKIVGLVVYR